MLDKDMSGYSYTEEAELRQNAINDFYFDHEDRLIDEFREYKCLDDDFDIFSCSETRHAFDDFCEMRFDEYHFEIEGLLI